MGANDSKSLQGLGFLTALEDEQQGWLGGLLILNAASRPLEFHCTAPVKPSRAQEILYGNTLGSYLCGDQIGAALTKKSGLQPLLYVTDVQHMLAVRPVVNVPVVFIEGGAEDAEHSHSSDACLRVDQPHASLLAPHANFVRFELRKQWFCVDKSFPNDEPSACAVLEELRTIDLHEPFLRVREALEETQLRKR